MLNDKYLNFTLKLLDISGYGPYKRPKFINFIFKWIQLLLTLILTVLVILCGFVNLSAITIEITSKLLESFGACLQVIDL